MATPTAETTRHGKGAGIILVDSVDFGVLTDEITFTPNVEYAKMMKGDWPISVLRAVLKKSIGGTLVFSVITIDRERQAQVLGNRYNSGAYTSPNGIEYQRMPKFNIQAQLSRWLTDDTAVTDEATGESGDDATKIFLVSGYTVSSLGKGLKPGSVTVHDEDDVEILTDNKDGTLQNASGDAGFINYVKGVITGATFVAAPASGKAIQVNYTPKKQRYEKIEIFAGAFIGEPEESYNSDNELVLKYTVEAVWDDVRCTTADGLYKIEPVDVT